MDTLGSGGNGGDDNGDGSNSNISDDDNEDDARWFEALAYAESELAPLAARGVSASRSTRSVSPSLARARLGTQSPSPEAGEG